MGVRVYLALVAPRVDDAAWSAIYADARRVAERWTPRPLAAQWRRVGAEKVVQYSTDVEHLDGFHIVGDAVSKTTAESFVFPSTLGSDFGPPRQRSCPDGDILVDIARYHEGVPATLPWRELFGNKTQGFPYHTLVVALGLLVEHRLPSTALLYGDLSSTDGETARGRLGEILEEEFELPVVADPARLRARLAAELEGEVLERAARDFAPTHWLGEGLAADLLGAMLDGASTSRVHHDLEHVARSCQSPARLHESTRQFLGAVLGNIRGYVQSAELREQLAQRDAVDVHEEIARSLSRRGLPLTAEAWDAIEIADADDLAFALAVARVDAREFAIHHALRALLENRTLRDL